MADRSKDRPAGAHNWARVELVRGQSTGAQWEVTGKLGSARVDVGSSPRCAWCVAAPGVSARQFEFYWDGQMLWIGDLYGTGSTRVDGEALSEWRALAGVVRVEFGQAAMRIETSAAAAVGDGNRPPETPVADDAKTRIFNSADADEPTRARGPDLTDSPTRARGPDLTDSPTRARGPDLTDSPTRAKQEGGEIAALPTRMLVTGDGLEPQQTRLVNSPVELSAQALRPMPGVGAERVATATAASPKPAPVSRPPPAAIFVPAPPAGFASAGGPGSADPIVGPAGSTARKGSLPPRAWILLGVTVLAAAGVLLMNRPEPATPAAHPPRHAGNPAKGPAPGTGIDKRRDTGTAAAEQDGGVPGPDPGASAEFIIVARPVASPRQAVDYLMTGQPRAALEAYRSLAATKPEQPAYAAMVRLLERRLRARCRNGVDSTTGLPCS